MGLLVNLQMLVLMSLSFIGTRPSADSPTSVVDYIMCIRASKNAEEVTANIAKEFGVKTKVPIPPPNIYFSSHKYSF